MAKAILSGALLTRRDVPPATTDPRSWPTSHGSEKAGGQMWGQAVARSGSAPSTNKRNSLFGPFARFGLVFCGVISLSAGGCVFLMHTIGHGGPKNASQSAPMSSNAPKLAPAIGASELLPSTAAMSVKPQWDSVVTGYAEALPTPAALSEMLVEEVAALLARGDALLATGDVVSARLYYERAAKAGNAQAALRLGETYDLSFLALARLNGVRGDPAVATHWYQYAQRLGAVEAGNLLPSLTSNENAGIKPQ